MVKILVHFLKHLPCGRCDAIELYFWHYGLTIENQPEIVFDIQFGYRFKTAFFARKTPLEIPQIHRTQSKAFII